MSAAAPLLDAYQDSPLIGLEFVVEVRRPGLEPAYHNFLCNRQTDRIGLIPCLISAEHRLAYLVGFLLFRLLLFH